MPSAECRRTWLQSPVQAATAARACALAANSRSDRSPDSRVECQDPVTALPGAEPGLPVDWAIPSRSHACRKPRAVYPLPWMLSCLSRCLEMVIGGSSADDGMPVLGAVKVVPPAGGSTLTAPALRRIGRRWRNRGGRGLLTRRAASGCGLAALARRGVEQVVDLAGYVAFEAADDLAHGAAFGGLLGDVGLGAGIDADAGDRGQ